MPSTLIFKPDIRSAVRARRKSATRGIPETRSVLAATFELFYAIKRRVLHLLKLWKHETVDMFLQFYENDAGDRVYTLKVTPRCVYILPLDAYC